MIMFQTYKNKTSGRDFNVIYFTAKYKEHTEKHNVILDRLTCI